MTMVLTKFLLPSEGREVEFWATRMDVEGRGIRGWFRRSLFWSHDNVDHWTCNEVVRWKPWSGEVHAKSVLTFGKKAVLACDGQCSKAWGISARPKLSFDKTDADDVAYLADDELGLAPLDPGTYEGGHAKPAGPAEMNKWCSRQCERSNLCEPGASLAMPSFAARVFNQPWKHLGCSPDRS